MSLDLASLDLTPAGAHLGERPDVWFRAWLDIAGVQHFLDLVSVHQDRQLWPESGDFVDPLLWLEQQKQQHNEHECTQGAEHHDPPPRSDSADETPCHDRDHQQNGEDEPRP